ncbi:hypothetical protein SUGI_0348530 [Cryptomeria japonica]|nr:hypothetical protein SUGI_0348530 [Cryptomeria japonica]
MTDLCASIPVGRLDAFMRGESLREGVETQFLREQKTEHDSALHNTHTIKMYWCSYGPKDNRKKSLNKKRMRTYKKKKGCTCHFIVKVLYGRPDVAILIFKQPLHVDKNGEACHGVDDTSNELCSQFAQNLPDECKAYIERLLLMDVSIDAIVDRHIDDAIVYDMLKKKDSFVTRKDVINATTRVRSIRSQKHFGLSSPWMLDMMVRFSHDSIISMDSTFATNKYGYQLYLCLVFDEQQSGVPIAWAMTSRNKIEDIQVWLMELRRQGKEKRPDWRINAFIMDDASAEIQAVETIFECRVILCIWHVRRAWLKNVYKYATKERAMDIFHCLGAIMMAMHESEESTMEELHTFFAEFSDQPCFLEYFYNTRCQGEGRITMWAKNFRNFSHANQDTNNAMESYHGKLKLTHLQTSMEKAKAIPDVDCVLDDTTPGWYRVKIQSSCNWYVVRKFGDHFYICECPWSLQGNMCKHALKVVVMMNNSFHDSHVLDPIPMLTPTSTNTNENPTPKPVVDTISIAHTNLEDVDTIMWNEANKKLNILLQTMSGSGDKLMAFVGCLDRFMADLQNTGAMSFDFRPSTDPANTTTKRMRPWFSASWVHHRNQRQHRHSSRSEIYHDVQQPLTFEFPFETSRRRRGKRQLDQAEEVHVLATASVVSDTGWYSSVTLFDTPSTPGHRSPRWRLDFDGLLRGEGSYSDPR